MISLETILKICEQRRSFSSGAAGNSLAHPDSSLLIGLLVELSCSISAPLYYHLLLDTQEREQNRASIHIS